jgi:hypothetical protein
VGDQKAIWLILYRIDPESIVWRRIENESVNFLCSPGACQDHGGQMSLVKKSPKGVALICPN